MSQMSQRQCFFASSYVLTVIWDTLVCPAWPPAASPGDKVLPCGVSHSPGCFPGSWMLMFEHASSASIHSPPREMTSPGALPKQRRAFGGHKSSARGRCRHLSVLQASVTIQTCQWPCGVAEAQSWLRLSPGICSSLICTVLFYTGARECLTEIVWVETD